MRHCLWLAYFISILLGTAPAWAQPSDAEDPDADASADDSEVGDEEGAEEVADGEARLRAPELEMPDVGDLDEPEDFEEEIVEEEFPAASIEDDQDLLEQAAPVSSDPTLTSWTSPQSVFTLHGYFRVRGELQDNFFLGRDGFDEDSGQEFASDAPFLPFVPADRRASARGGCAERLNDGSLGDCPGGSDRLRFANMRLRLRPTLSLSDDVRVHMMLDVFDNMVLGSTPDSLVVDPNTGARVGSTTTGPRVPGVPVDTLTNTQNPPESGRNSLSDSLRVRRAWAEVTNRGLGQLRFGRMGHHWGLGMLWNAGDGIDSDFQSEVDRIMVLTKLAGFFFGVAWDFADEGLINRRLTNLQGIPFDATQRDDVRQFSFLVARRMDVEEQAQRLQRGDWVLNGGIYFVLRKQGFSSASVDPFAPIPTDQVFEGGFVRRGAKVFIPDIWVQFLWRDLRLELEASWVAGEIRNTLPDDFDNQRLKLRQFGFAFESEYRVLEQKLGIHMHTGFATGDRDVNGLSSRDDTVTQIGDNRNISHFSFHPNYRIDLILFRNILGRVGGVWYFKPGVSYDIFRNAFGQLFGARVDFIYSRANQEVQTYGGEPSLGLEIDASLYYRSEDGPDLVDGFYAQFHYGVLFPFQGLDYRDSELGTGVTRSVGRAQTLRLILGVQF